MRGQLPFAMALWIGRRLHVILPPDRRTWAEAMSREIEAVPKGGEALLYAAGCVWAVGREGFGHVCWIPSAIRVALGAATSLLTGIAAFTSGRVLLNSVHSGGSLPVPALLALVAAGCTYAVAAICVIRRGPSALIPLAVAILTLDGWSLMANPTPSPSSFFQALRIEALGIWSLLLFAALAALAFTRVARMGRPEETGPLP